MAHGILIPRPGIEPMPPAVEAQGPNHWSSREFLGETLMYKNLKSEKKIFRPNSYDMTAFGDKSDDVFSFPLFDM